MTRTESGPSILSNRSLSRYQTTPEGESRVLILINGFSGTPERPRSLEGRVKLAKLDFLLRYPNHLRRLAAMRGKSTEKLPDEDPAPLDTRMMRYRYGPWDPSYFAILGSLIGRQLIEVVPAVGSRALGYRTTSKGRALVELLKDDGTFEDLLERVRVLKRDFDLTGANLMKLVYRLPEVNQALWHEEIE